MPMNVSHLDGTPLTSRSPIWLRARQKYEGIPLYKLCMDAETLLMTGYFDMRYRSARLVVKVPILELSIRSDIVRPELSS